MKNSFAKIKERIFREDLDLSKKWWHRFLKVLFVISILSLTTYSIILLVDSYERIVNRWTYVESLSKRLGDPTHAGQIFSIKQLYGNNEIITERQMYSDDYHPGLGDKELIQPLSAMFLQDYDSENFCSNELYKQIQNIAEINKIKLFSPVNPNFRTLSGDLDAFTDYLKNNSYIIKCVMMNSYSIENENGSTSKYVFLEPINTYDYNIYKYESGFGDFILAIFLTLIGLIIYTLIAIIIYYKIILYIVFGNKK